MSSLEDYKDEGEDAADDQRHGQAEEEEGLKGVLEVGHFFFFSSPNTRQFPKYSTALLC